jgi:hypothetical protein
MTTIDRNFERGLRAGRAAQATARGAGSSAMEAAKAMIDAAFGEAALCTDFKARVAAALATGTAHPANKLRYRARARMLRGKGLAAAIATVERWHKAERKAFQVASLFGRPPRLPLIVLSELRLILRVFRRSGMADQFPALVESLLEARTPEQFLAAAE